MAQRLQSRAKPQNQKKPSTQATELTFLEHIYEVRSRLFWVVLVLVITSAFGFQIKDQLIDIVMAPLHGEKLVYLTPGGGFSFIFTLSIYFGVLLAIPFATYHLYRFLRPLLQSASRKLLMMLLLLSTLLAASGALFGYFVTIPAALDFLSTFAGDAVMPNLTADSYLNFVAAYVVGLALLFQLPLLLYLFDHIRPFPPGSLLATQRFVIIGATIAAAVITPTPDAINMAIVAVPIIAVYQLGAIAVYIKRKARLARAKRNSVKQVTTVDSDDSLTKILDEIARTTLRKPATISDTIKPSSSPARPVVAMQPALRRSVRSVDGFGAVRRTSNGIAVPSRPTASPGRPLASRGGQPARSIDGFLPA